ncbi:hypothetical protein VNO80_00382 [Phaseolus coccineus]|uniref:TIR domain-containing protein n=1 Tax=Phaseolus coccineus TaxID=3886 RepID=A0AAN9P410_PHACN
MLLLKYLGNEAIRSIVINLLRMKQLHKSQVFTKMRKLHFLNLYTAGARDILLCEPWGLYLPQGLESLPNYPLESLPSKFSAENLVELHLPYSRVKKLWLEVPYNLTTVQTWRFALKESANVAGFHSSTFRDEAELVKEIVKCVSSMVHSFHVQKHLYT